MSIPITPTTAERLTILEASVVTLKMQNRAILNSLQAMATSIQSLAEIGQATQDRITGVDKLYRDLLIKQAVQLAIDYGNDDQQPSWEDQWEVDQHKTDLTLLHRVEDVVLDG